MIHYKMVFIVLRHGESQWNKENRFTGFTDVPLSENGKEEAEQVADILRNTHIHHIFTSHLERTITTGEIIKKQQSHQPEISHIKELCERDYGDLTGKNKQELIHTHGETLVKTWRRSFYEGPPNGENLDMVTQRVGDTYNKYMAPLLHEKKNIVFVGHGNSIRALFVHLGIKDEKTIEEFEVPTGVIIQLCTDSKKYRFENRHQINAYQIIDSRGFPTIETQCIDKYTGKIVGKGSCPSGASCGSTEVLELRDNDKSLYCGKSVFRAIQNINEFNNHFSLKRNVITNLKKCDAQLNEYDKTPMKSLMGGNATTSISFCMANVGANLLDIELYKYIHKIYNVRKGPIVLPTPMANIINGGKHTASEYLKIQEIMIFPRHDLSVSDKMRLIVEIYHCLRITLEKRYGPAAKSIGDEGGFCPPIYDADEALNVLEEVIQETGYIVNKDVFFALDCAASEFYNAEYKVYNVESDLELTSSEMVNYYDKLIEKHPAIKSIEDAFHETDYEAWKRFTETHGNNIMIVGDDLFTTNPKLIKQGLEEKWANSLLLKVNQIGTISEAVESAQLLFSENKEVIVSHRSGETNHSIIVDLAIGIGARFLKIGSPCRGERVAKFNRLIEIEHNLHKI